MYGEAWCRDCELHYFPRKDGQRKSHKCDPQHVKTIFLFRIRDKQRKIDTLEKEIEGYHKKINRVLLKGEDE